MNQSQTPKQSAELTRQEIDELYAIDRAFENSAHRSHEIRAEAAKSPSTPEKKKRTTQLVLRSAVGVAAVTGFVMAHNAINNRQEPQESENSTPEYVEGAVEPDELKFKASKPDEAGMITFTPKKD